MLAEIQGQHREMLTAMGTRGGVFTVRYRSQGGGGRVGSDYGECGGSAPPRSIVSGAKDMGKVGQYVWWNNGYLVLLWVGELL